MSLSLFKFFWWAP